MLDMHPTVKKRRSNSPTPGNTSTLPHWEPPPQTPPPQATPNSPSTNQIPEPTLPMDQPSNQPIPLMSITFTPHTTRQIKSRLHQLHTLRTHYMPHHTYTPTIIPLLQTITHLLNTINHIATTLSTYYSYTHFQYP